jgi:hypothetical protein
MEAHRNMFKFIQQVDGGVETTTQVVCLAVGAVPSVIIHIYYFYS